MSIQFLVAIIFVAILVLGGILYTLKEFKEMKKNPEKYHDEDKDDAQINRD